MAVDTATTKGRGKMSISSLPVRDLQICTGNATMGLGNWQETVSRNRIFPLSAADKGSSVAVEEVQ